MKSEKSSWVTKHQLLSFFILTFAINCIITYSSKYLIHIPSYIVWFFQIFSPTLSAVAISGLIGGTDQIIKLFSGFARFKVGLKWYVAAILLALVPLAVSLVYIALGNQVPGMAAGTTPLFLLSNLIFTLFSGPIAEEAGWRGFALPRLQKRFNSLLSSIILGSIWACWHLPFYTVSGGGAGMPFYIYFVMVVVLSIFLTWIYNNTKGSLALCVLTHFSFNFGSAFIAGYLGLLPKMLYYMGCGALLGILIVVIILVFGPKNLSKKDLVAWKQEA